MVPFETSTEVTWCGRLRRYAIGFGDRTSAGLSGVGTNSAGYPGVNGGVSTNNPFLGTRFFAMHDLPWNQYNLWFFQWTVRPPLSARVFRNFPLFSLFLFLNFIKQLRSVIFIAINFVF